MNIKLLAKLEQTNLMNYLTNLNNLLDLARSRHIRNRLHSWAAVCTLCTATTSAFAMTQDDDFEYQAFLQRERFGAHSVIAISRLVDSYRNSSINEATFISGVWNDCPVIAAALYQRWGSYTSDQFLSDLIFAQTNGPIGYGQNGEPIFFDAQSTFARPELGEISAEERAELALQANQLLQGKWVSWYADPITMLQNLTNNKCCRQDTVESCVPSTGHNCVMSKVANLSNSSSHMCPSVIGP